MNALCEANGAFAIHLLKLLGQDNPEHNVFCSPVSISSALAMVLLGAKGSTAAQMVQALGLSSVEDPHGGFQSLLPQVHKPGAPYSLSIANRLFGEESCEFLPSFQESCVRFYQAELEPLSFATAPERSRKHINAWVSRKTEGKIPELLAKNSIDEESRLVLINAVYFKGKWDEQFDKSCTRKMPFKINQKEQRPVQMMFQEGKFPWAHVSEVRAQVLELPYEGQELSMVLVLPDEGVDLSTLHRPAVLPWPSLWPLPAWDAFLPKSLRVLPCVSSAEHPWEEQQPGMISSAPLMSWGQSAGQEDTSFVRRKWQKIESCPRQGQGPGELDAHGPFSLSPLAVLGTLNPWTLSQFAWLPGGCPGIKWAPLPMWTFLFVGFL
ncbi:serpin B9-like isoform X3 [Cavia porcellus]